MSPTFRLVSLKYYYNALFLFMENMSRAIPQFFCGKIVKCDEVFIDIQDTHNVFY